jgi:hypothetical protein
MASRVTDWLAAAGLSRHARAFAGMPEGQFLGMMMQVRQRFCLAFGAPPARRR